MIPYTLKDQHGKELFKFELPQSWEEITLAQLIAWEKESKRGEINFCRQLEILTGIPEATWFNCSEISVDEKLLPLLEWMQVPMNARQFMELPLPEAITIDGAVIEVTKDIDLKTFGQKITFQTEMKKYIRREGEEFAGIELEFYPKAIAIYLYPGKPFEDSKAFDFAKHIEKLPLSICYPLAHFFFHKFIAYQSASMINYSTNRMKINSAQALMN